MLFKKALTRVKRVASLLLCVVFCLDCKIPEPKQAPDGLDNFQKEMLTSEIYIDSKFSSIERQLIVEGLREWERATDHMIVFNIHNVRWTSGVDYYTVPQPDSDGVIECTRDIHIVRVLSYDKVVVDISEQIKKEEHLKEFNLAGYANSTCQVKNVLLVADRVQNEEEYVSLTIHEIGHMLGLKHIRIGKTSAMVQGLQHSAPCVTKLDIQQFCNGWGCDESKMSPCN